MVNADEIAKLCFERFNQLPRRGSLSRAESGPYWPLWSKSPGVLTLTQVGQRSDILNDSHAEVIARRGCVRYLIQELHRAVSSADSSVFRPADQQGKWCLQPGVSFLFFTSHTPCGDASIIPMTDSQSQPCPPVRFVKCHEGTDVGGDLKRKAEEPNEWQNNKLHSQNWCKVCSGWPSRPSASWIGYHSTGALRVKPGRGEPTLSLSCSDKMAHWTVLGFQGALLSHYLQDALYFSTIVVGKCPYSKEVMQRALVTRCSTSQTSLLVSVFVHQCCSNPAWSFHLARLKLCCSTRPDRDVSPLWGSEQPLDVTANGYKHGVTKKAFGTAKARSFLCKLELFHSFLSLVAATNASALPSSLRCSELTQLHFCLAPCNQFGVQYNNSDLINLGKRTAQLLGLQAGITVIPAGLAAATQPGLPSVATEQQRSPALPLRSFPPDMTADEMFQLRSMKCEMNYFAK
ncbi:hypothetical protein INR49_025083 [Caranx melampygus]|nr:hypothetical protein INR49_025083 [Caranx melampygus]